MKPSSSTISTTSMSTFNTTESTPIKLTATTPRGDLLKQPQQKQPQLQQDGVEVTTHSINNKTPDNTTIMIQNKSTKQCNDAIDINVLNDNDDVIVKHAKRLVRNKIKKSFILNNSNQNQTEGMKGNSYNNLPKINESEMIIDKILGRGGFCIVNEVRIMNNKKSTSSNNNKENKIGMTSMTKSLSRSSAVMDSYSINSPSTSSNSITNKKKSMTSITKSLSRSSIGIVSISSNNSSSTNKKEGNIGGTNNDNHQVLKTDYPYAMKRICPKLYKRVITGIDGFEYQEDDVYKQPLSILISGIADLIIEAQYLSILNHPHIIKLHAITNHSPYYNYRHYGIIFDKLNCMLSLKLIEWKKYNQFNTNPFTHLLFDNDSIKEQSCFYNRLQYSYHIATAIQYLHENNIMYRDLKPDNIGFDIMNEIKLIDFGLIKEYDNTKRNVDDGLFYHITGNTGSPQYMCPRVANKLPYNESCDVYSFCVLLWQILQLEIPFEKYNYIQLRTKVLIEGIDGERPKIHKYNLKKKWWSQNIQDLLNRGWSYDYKVRPTMKDICIILNNELQQYYNQKDIKKHHRKNNSNPLHNDDKIEQDSVTETGVKMQL